MRSSANLIKGQGVGSCYDEQVALMKECGDVQVTENGHGDYDIIHYHTLDFLFYLNRMAQRNKSVGVGYVHFLPNTLDDSLRLPRFVRSIFYKYVIGFYNSMDYLVTVNPYFIDEIRKYNITRPEVVYIPNFVDSKAFHPVTPEESEEIRAKYGIEKSKFVAVGVGQLQTRKGVLDFVETAKQLPDIQFVWAGGFSFGKISKGYYDIKRVVKNPPDNVKFLGIIDRENMSEIYNMSDVMFLPSYDECFPMSILEALCCKKPVLVRNVPLYDKILFNYCPRGSSVGEFAEKLAEMSINRSEYEEWEERAWQCHSMYTKNKVMEQWSSFYGEAYAQATCTRKWVLTR